MGVEKELKATLERALERVIEPLLRRLDRIEELNQAKSDGKILWTEAEAAVMLGIAPLTLKKWRLQCKVKSHTPLGARRPLYRWQDIQRIATQLAEGSLHG